MSRCVIVGRVNTYDCWRKQIYDLKSAFVAVVNWNQTKQKKIKAENVAKKITQNEDEQQHTLSSWSNCTHSRIYMFQQFLDRWKKQALNGTELRAWRRGWNEFAPPWNCHPLSSREGGGGWPPPPPGEGNGTSLSVSQFPSCRLGYDIFMLRYFFFSSEQSSGFLERVGKNVLFFQELEVNVLLVPNCFLFKFFLGLLLFHFGSSECIGIFLQYR